MNFVKYNNYNSELHNLLDKRSKELRYDIKNNYKNLIKIQEITVPYLSEIASSDLYGKKVIFKLGNYGLLRRLTLKCILTSSGDNTLMITDFANYLFSNINLRNSRGIIQSLNPYILMYYKYYDYDRYELINSLNNSDVEFNSNSITIYLPLPFFFSSKMESFLYSYQDELELELITNTYANYRLNAGATGLSVELIQDFVQMDDIIHIYSPYLISDYVEESVINLNNSETSYSFYLESKKCIFKTIFFVDDITSDPLYRVTNLTITVNGIIIYTADRNLNKLQFERDVNSEFLVYNWGLENSHDINSGSINLDKLTVKIDLEWDTAAADNCKLRVFHLYHDVLKLNNGKYYRD